MTDEVVLHDVDGGEIPLSEFQDPQTILVFFSATCASCNELAPKFRTWPDSLQDDTDIQPVFVGRPEDYEVAGDDLKELVPHAWYDYDSAAMLALRLMATPSAVLVNAENPNGVDQVMGDASISALTLRHSTVGVTGYRAGAQPPRISFPAGASGDSN